MRVNTNKRGLFTKPYGRGYGAGGSTAAEQDMVGNHTDMVDKCKYRMDRGRYISKETMFVRAKSNIERPRR